MRRPTSTSALRRPRLLAASALAAASLAFTGLGVGSAVAESPVPPIPTPTNPVVTPVLTPTPNPQVYAGTVCIDPLPGAVEKTSWVSSYGPTSVVGWSLGFGCFPLPVRVITEVDGKTIADTVTTGTSSSVSIPGLQMGGSYDVKITAIFASLPGSTGTGDKKVLGDFKLVVPWADPVVTPVVTPTPSPTPSPTPTPSPSPSPTPEAIPDYGGICVDPPQYTTPKTYEVTALTPTTATVYWFLGGGCFRMPIVTTLSVDGIQRERLVGGPTTVAGDYKVTGLAPGSTHRIKITAEYRSVGDSAFRTKVLGETDVTTPRVDSTPTPVPTPTPTPKPSTVEQTYILNGNASLKTLTKGSLPLSGVIDAKLDLGTGDFSGQLGLSQSTGNLTALGFLPVVAKVVLLPTDAVTGTLKAGKLSAIAKIRIKLPSVKTLGIELAGGANCQAKQISSVTLKSTQEEFLPLEGGPIAGTFAISNLTGCGFLTGLVSPLTQGSGNTIALNLIPAPLSPRIS